MKTFLALDSGAFSMYRKSVLGGGEKKNPRVKNKAQSVSAKIASRGRRGDGYYESEQYQNYFASYVDYVKQHKRKLDYYVTLDAMFDAERTWQATLQLEKAGLKPMPVFHYGEDFAYLKRYMDRCDYIGIGGIARGVGTSRRMAFLRQVFGTTHFGTKSKQEWKLHGFGLTSTELMRQFPWYSVDSYSPLALANNGKLQMPELIYKHGKLAGFDFTRSGKIIYMTRRLNDRGNAFASLTPRYVAALRVYLEEMGLTLEQMYKDGKPPHKPIGEVWRHAIKEPKREDEGTLGTCRTARSFANLYTYAKTAEALSDLRESPLRIYFSGSINGTDIDMFMKQSHQNKFREFCWLGTFFDVATIKAFMERGWDMGHEYRPSTRPRLEPR